MNEYLEYIKVQCTQLQKECEDYWDAMSYAPDIFTDTKDRYPQVEDEQLESDITSILKSVFGRD
jgi:hypothetical protein